MRKRMNKDVKTLTIIAIILSLGVLLVYLGSSLATPDSSLLRDQLIDNLSLTDANLEYVNGISTYTVKVTNNNSGTYALKYIKVKVTLPEDKEYNLIGYIGENISSGETRDIKASIDVDLTSATNIEYSIVK